MMRRVLFILAFFLGSPLWADIVHLKDGSRVDGVIKREPGGWAVTDAAGKVTHVTDDNIDSIEKSSNLSPADLAANKLATLRRSVENVADINVVIERFQKFIEQNPNIPAGRDAAKELETWKDRQARGLIKLGTIWLTPEQHAAELKKSVAVVEKIREMIKTGKMRDADAAIAQLLALDGSNISGIYLKGVSAYKQGNVPVAQKSFERVRELLPEHGPTLNNLAVIMTRQKQPLGALAIYDLAMQASPNNRQILDNTAEGLFAVPEKQRNSQTYKNAAKHFEEQDAELQKQLVSEGLVRWGSTYVPKAQMDELKKAQDKIKDKLDALVQERDRVLDRIDDIDNAIAANNRSLQRIASDYTVTDASGRLVQLRFPNVYYDIRRDNDRLSERETLEQKLDTFEERAQKIRADGPVPQYSGQQRIIEGEGTPLAVGQAASTAVPGKSGKP